MTPPDEREGPPGSKRRRRRRERARNPRQERALGAGLPVLLGIVVAGSVLAVGAVHVPTLLVVMLLATAAAGIAVWSGQSWPIPAALCAALAGYTLLQALPLPARWVARLAPANADIWARALVPLAESAPAWVSLSLDPGASWVEALKWATYAMVFVAACALARQKGPGLTMAIVFCSSVAAAFATIAHGLLGAKKVFGLYEPMFAPAPWHVGPLLNPNNLSGYLTLGTLCGLGLLLTRRPVMPRWLVGLGVATNIGVNVTAASRAGAIALPIGVLALGLAMSWRSRARGEGDSVAPSTARWLVLVALGGGAVLALLGATTETWKELWDQNIEKLTATRWVVPLIREHAWLGVGRGAFESTFPAFRNAPGNLVFTHAESFPVDWVAGWGIPVGVAALAAFGWAFRPRALGVRSSVLAAAGWAGVFALAVQNLADLGLEIPALPLAAAAVWGSLWGERQRRSVSSTDGEDAYGPRAGWRVGFIVAGMLTLGAAALLLGRHDLTSERRDVHERLRSVGDGREDRAAFRRELRAAILRHPAEPYFPLIGATLAWKARDQDPMPWLSRALERDLTGGRAHLLTAEVVAARGAKSQALMELRLAVTDDASLAGPAARLAGRWTKNCDELASTAPLGEAGAEMLCTLAVLIDVSLAHCREPLVKQAVERAPSEAWPRSLAASALLEHLRNAKSDPTCGGDRRAQCEAEIERHARVLEVAKPSSSVALVTRAHVVRFQGSPERGEQLLREGCPAFEDREGCLRARVEIAAEARPPTNLVPAIKDYLGAACVSTAACAGASTAMADLMAARGDWATAVTFFERAARESPTEARWLSLANAASRAGAHAQAAAALEKVVQLRGSVDPELRQRIEGEKRKALGVQ